MPEKMVSQISKGFVYRQIPHLSAELIFNLDFQRHKAYHCPHEKGNPQR